MELFCNCEVAYFYLSVSDLSDLNRLQSKWSAEDLNTINLHSFKLYTFKSDPHLVEFTVEQLPVLR